jgi:hypothetical protein
LRHVLAIPRELTSINRGRGGSVGQRGGVNSPRLCVESGAGCYHLDLYLWIPISTVAAVDKFNMSREQPSQRRFKLTDAALKGGHLIFAQAHDLTQTVVLRFKLTDAIGGFNDHPPLRHSTNRRG